MFLQIASEANNDLKNDKNCYNCEKKEHIAKNYFEFKQNNFQVNVVKDFRQNIQQNKQKALSLRIIIKVLNDSKN